MGLAPLMLRLTCPPAVRNQRILAAGDARQADDTRRTAAACPENPAPAPQDPASPATAAPP